MSIRLWNTASHKLEIFKPIKKGRVGLYTCGPTVYNFAHIGNLRTYIFEDVLERTLARNGYKVHRAMNITDVGHLTGDSDLGDDKMEKEAKTKREVLAIAKKYTKAFLLDAKKLNIKIPKDFVPATKFIPEQISLTKILLKNGFAYETKNAVYFNVRKFKKYGRLSGQKLEAKAVASRAEVVEDSNKKNPQDFALWFKLEGKFKNHIQHWPSPWGKGFPGWHLECSAISRKLLGQPFDIHTGGVDHIGTHHTNEIAQSEAAYGKPLANYWLHSEFLLIDKNKMAKSAKNFFTLQDVETKSVNPLAYRYLTLSAHYRSRLNFTWESLASAEKGLEGLYSHYAKLKAQARTEKTQPNTKLIQKNIDKFTEIINQDLDTPRAIVLTYETVRDPKLSAKEKVIILDNFDTILGLGLRKPKAPKLEQTRDQVPFEILQIAKRREEFRSNKQFMQADALREELNSLGYVVEDTIDGPIVLKSSTPHKLLDNEQPEE